MLNLNLNDISSISKSSNTYPTNQLICSLCYEIAYNGKKCNNRKCQKVFCNTCMEKQLKLFLIKDKKEIKCPFCMTFSSFSNIDEAIINYINEFKYFCKKNKNCKEQYSLEQIIKDHSHKNDNYPEEKCYICKKIIIQTNLNSIKCALCYNTCCFKNISYNALTNKDNKYENNIINNQNKNKICIKKCFICELPICNYCSKGNNNNNNIICEECQQNYKCNLCHENNIKIICIFCKNVLCENCVIKCEFCNYNLCKQDCLSKKLLCQNCSNLNSKLNYFNCYHQDIFNCPTCYKKCSLCKKNTSDIKCNVCYNEICIKNCSIKCKFCSTLCCNKCTLVCLICKKILCQNCAKICSECDIGIDSITLCNKCDSNVIQKCKLCDKLLCINCWNVCNFCGMILCSKHCNTCSNCEDAICDKHYAKCDKCLTKDELNFVKLCFKKCVNYCSFCDNQTTVLCKEKNHADNYVQNFGCQHNICNSCIQKCATCGKIVRKCLDCIDYFYEFCRYCKQYQCLNCCKKCKNCDEVYCSMKHICSLCGIVCDNQCFNCDIMKKNKCYICGEKLKICENCKNKYICSFECYKQNFTENKITSINNHLCRMYVCKEHF